MRFGGYCFTPSMLMTILYVSIGTAMLGLGYWQMQRAAEKIELQSAADAAATQDPVAMFDLASTDALDNYARVVVSGVPDPSRQLLWDNRIHNGVAGFEVILPIRLDTEASDESETSTLVLVNRGWVALGASRQQLPEVYFEANASVQLVGTLTRPSKGFSSGPAVESSGSWPRLLQHFDYAEIEQSLGESVLPLVVELHEDQTRATLVEQGFPLYPTNWQPVSSGPERHYGYAFQWWAMFVALTGLFVVLNTRKIQLPAA